MCRSAGLDKTIGFYKEVRDSKSDRQAYIANWIAKDRSANADSDVWFKFAGPSLDASQTAMAKHHCHWRGFTGRNGNCQPKPQG